MVRSFVHQYTLTLLLNQVEINWFRSTDVENSSRTCRQVSKAATVDRWTFRQDKSRRQWNMGVMLTWHQHATSRLHTVELIHLYRLFVE